MRTTKRFIGLRWAGAGRAGKIPAVLFLVAAIFIFGPATAANAQIGHMDIGAGSSFSIPPGGMVHMGCGDFNVLGQGTAEVGDGLLDQVTNVLIENLGSLSMLTGLLEFSQSWTLVPGGIFNAGEGGTVAIVDECGAVLATVMGSSTFCRFLVKSDAAKEVQFEIGTTQTVACHFEATGAPGMLEKIRSTQEGLTAYICLLPGGTQMVDSVDVMDVAVPNLEDCLRLAPGEPEEHNSVDNGNSFGWFENYGTIVPTLSEVGIAVMALVMLMLGGLAIRRKSPTA